MEKNSIWKVMSSMGVIGSATFDGLPGFARLRNDTAHLPRLERGRRVGVRGAGHAVSLPPGGAGHNEALNQGPGVPVAARSASETGRGETASGGVPPLAV